MQTFMKSLERVPMSSLMRIFRGSLSAGLVLAAAYAPTGRAQQQPAASAPSQTAPAAEQPQAPIPAYHSPLASQADNSSEGNVDDSQKIVPDDHALAGAQGLTLGSSETSRSYWQPHADVSATADSNAFGSTPGWTTYESITAGINLHKISGHSDLTLGYAAGGVFSSDGSIGNSVIQQLNFAERVTARRFVFSFIDNMNDLPQATLGYGSVTGIDTGLQTGVAPTDSILTTRGQRIDNSFVSEMDVNLTPRSSFTFLGGYYLLHYFSDQADLLNSHTITGQAGYNRKLTAKDTLAVLYRFSGFRYDNLNQSINDNVVQLSYGRSVTGRLAFQLAAGPDFTFFATPILQNNLGTITSSSEVNWSANGSLTYQLRRGSVGATYFHGVSTGSGFAAGSINDTLTARFSRQLSRTVNGTISGGYARNDALAVAGFGIFNQNYNYTFAGASVSRPFGRTLNLFLSYQAQYQYSNDAFCVGVTCSTSVVAHLISVGLHWQARPMLF
jgi:hypothetical protein